MEVSILFSTYIQTQIIIFLKVSPVDFFESQEWFKQKEQVLFWGYSPSYPLSFLTGEPE